MDVVLALPVEQADHVVTGGKSFVVMEFALEHAFVKIAAHANLQGACQAPHDVDAVVGWVAHEEMVGEVWFARL